MGIPVREHTIEQIEARLNSMNTALNKINYLESAVNATGFGLDIKKFLWQKLSDLYSERKMYERAARAMANKAGLEVSTRDKIDSYITSAELYSIAGKVEDADNMFLRAIRDVAPIDKAKVVLARKNIYLKMAEELEGKGRKASAVKFYEKLLKMSLEGFEKNKIKEKLIETYKSLGMFREMKLLEGL
jgi:tetratricopeptide (TPR) repeat protein